MAAGLAKEPSEYLAALRSDGFTVLDGVVSKDALERIRQATRQQVGAMRPAPPAFDARFGLPHGIAWSADICRAVTHPVALWIIRSYLETDYIHFCHQPAMTVLRPAKTQVGTYPEGGWHSDYPYHASAFPEDRWLDDAVYGVQFNICIDEFRVDNAATQFVPGSHRLKQFPPSALNQGGTRAGIPPHRDVAQMLAPAGAALIYDSRIWHRACTELNVSGKDRLAILNAVCPGWVPPMSDKSPGSDKYVESGMAQQLSDREQLELERLCLAETRQPPRDAPLIRHRTF